LRFAKLKIARRLAVKTEEQKTKILVENLEQRLNFQVLYNGKFIAASELYNKKEIVDAAQHVETLKEIHNEAHAKLLKDEIDFATQKAKLAADADDAYNLARQKKQLEL